MKILPYDKVHALKRSEKYRKDYQRYSEERNHKRESDFFISGGIEGEKARVLSVRGEELCKKWHIRSPINPDVPYTPGEEACVHAPVTYLDPPARWKRIVSNDGKDGYKECITHINGKLVLMIDSAYSADQIKAEISRILSVWTRATNDRAKKSKPDIWKIYDVILAGKTICEVAKIDVIKNTPKGCKPIVSETDIKRIQTSYGKACRIIAAVEGKKTTVTPVDPMEATHKNPKRKPSDK
jgi:hypothetical protein